MVEVVISYSVQHIGMVRVMDTKEGGGGGHSPLASLSSSSPNRHGSDIQGRPTRDGGWLVHVPDPG